MTATKTLKRIFVGLFFSNAIFLQAQINETKLFIESLSKRDYKVAYDLFDTIVSKKISLDQLGTVWDGLQTKIGAYEKHKDVRLEESNIIYTTCKFQKTELDLKLVYTPDKKIKAFFFVPVKPGVPYHKPNYDNEASYSEKELTVKTNSYSLPAILTLPGNKKNPPVIILIHGSGPSDKDETVGPNKIFRDLAVGLAANGIATLRYDKRTKVYAGNLNADSITIKEETTDDAISAINLVSTNSEIDKSQVYLLGHSLGGMLAPEIALNTKNLKGIILLAANARPLEDLILEQTKYILSLDNSLSNDKKEQLKTLEKQVAKAKSNTLNDQTPSSELPLGVPANYWIALNKYHPLETAKKLNLKILVLQGERDYQVTMTDYNLWKKELSNNKKAYLKSYPKLNHLFIEGESKSVPDEYEQPGNVSVEVINDISTWINGQR